MSRKANLHSSYSAALAIALFVVFVAGCHKEDPITQYTQEKTPRARMLAAIAKHGTTAWFFKLTAPVEDVSEVETQFKEFVRSVQFGPESDAEPEWILPGGWQQLPDNAPRNQGRFPRHATLTVPANGSQLELTVTSLPLGPFITQGDGWQMYQLQNVNRWRGELQLLPMRSQEELLANTEQVALADGSATLVDIVGRPPAKAETESSGSMAGGLPPDHPPISADERPTVADGSRSEVDFELPEGWKPAPLARFSVLTFEAVEGSESVATTVTPVGGSVLFNVNRWCTQEGVDLPTFKSEADLQSVLQEITVDGAEGVYVELVGKSRTVLGVLVTQKGKPWVIALKGDNNLAQREKENFKSFVRSLEF